MNGSDNDSATLVFSDRGSVSCSTRLAMQMLTAVQSFPQQQNPYEYENCV
jgi:hypothetical protein